MTQRWKNVSVERRTAINGKHKDSAQKEMLAVSATTAGVERKHNRPLLLRGRRHKSDGRKLSKGKSLRGRSPSPCRHLFP